MKLETWLDKKLSTIQEKNLFREMSIASEPPSVCFTSNDYLGLSRHPALKQAAARATEEWGSGSSASRLMAGTLPLHMDLEKEVASWQEKEAAILFNSGYNAGIGIIPAIASGGIIFSDELNHACLIDGCRLSGARLLVYKHNDMEHLERLLKVHTDSFPRWIVSETIFSMEGEGARLQDFVRLKEAHGAFLFLDEAHAVGVYGKKGRGLCEELSATHKADLIMGTFSKALGSFGAFAVGSRKLIAYLTNTARSFIFTTSLPPAVIAANLEAVRLVAGMEKERLALRETARKFRDSLKASDFSARGEDSPIVPILLGDPERALHLAKLLQEQGLSLAAIRPPTVPEGTSRLRITLTLRHTKEDCERLLNALEETRCSAA